MKLSMISLVAMVFLSSADAVAQESSASIPEEWRRAVRGSGDAILFIHGGIVAGPPETFLTQDALADYQLISYNRRGYPGSPPELGPVDDYLQRHASDAATLLGALGIDGAHVVGHSSGGTIALQLALSNPELVRSLVLLEPAIPTVIAASDSPQDAGDQAQLIEHVQESEFVAALDLFFATQAGMPEWRTLFSPAEVRQGEAYAQTFFFFEAQAVGTWTPPQDLVSDSLPVLYVSGSESSVPIDYVDAIAVWFPQTEAIEIPDVGHELYAVDPESVAVGIADFLNRF